MKTRTFVSMAVLTGLIFTAPVAWADASPKPNMGKYQHAQKHRIQAGIRKGDLTRSEVRHLVKEQRRIHRMQRHFRSDGNISPREHHRLHRAKAHADRHIFRARHNDRKRY